MGFEFSTFRMIIKLYNAELFLLFTMAVSWITAVMFAVIHVSPLCMASIVIIAVLISIAYAMLAQYCEETDKDK